ncbi:MAG: hypothetical protein JWM82_197 [Myxococcales bacterium]|jgi:hypothetical protein|nr:hypothetical protein [Myxococcales bacterium]
MISTGANQESSHALALIGTSPSEVRARLAAWQSTAKRELSERPLRTLSLALGAGYLLGGGLFSRLTWRAASLAVRFGLPSMLSLVDADDDDDDEPEDVVPTRSSKGHAHQTSKSDLASRKRRT